MHRLRIHANLATINLRGKKFTIRTRILCHATGLSILLRRRPIARLIGGSGDKSGSGRTCVVWYNNRR